MSGIAIRGFARGRLLHADVPGLLAASRFHKGKLDNEQMPVRHAHQPREDSACRARPAAARLIGYRSLECSVFGGCEQSRANCMVDRPRQTPDVRVHGMLARKPPIATDARGSMRSIRPVFVAVWRRGSQIGQQQIRCRANCHGAHAEWLSVFPRLAGHDDVSVYDRQ